MNALESEGGRKGVEDKDSISGKQSQATNNLALDKEQK